VKNFIEWCREEKISVDQKSVIQYIDNFNSGSTKNQIIAALKSFLVYYGKEVKHLKQVPVVSASRNHLDDDEQRKLLQARLYSKTKFGAIKDTRNQLLIRLMMKSGLRVSEAVNIKRNDIDIRKRSIRVRGEHVKRNKERLTYMDSNTATLMHIYIKKLRIADPEQRVFTIQPPAFRKIFKRYLELAGLDNTYSPHCLRHTFAIHYMQNGGKIDKLKKILGHSDINTTSIYLNYTDDELKEEYDQIIK